MIADQNKRIRYMAKKQGYTVTRSRYSGLWEVIDKSTGVPVLRNATTDFVEAYLHG